MVALLCKIVYGRLQIDKFHSVTYGRLGKNCLEAFISGRPFVFFSGKGGRRSWRDQMNLYRQSHM